MNAALLIVAGAFGLVSVAASAAAQDAPQPASTATQVWFRISTQWIAASALVDPADTWLNRGNRTLAVPQASWFTELRSNARLEVGSRFQLVVRPRARGVLETAHVSSSPTTTRRDATFEMTEAYLSWRPVDAVTVSYGLQNFQWGPADMMGPSNRIFHEVGIFRDALYSVRGKHLARVNVSAGRQWSLVALAEVGATDEQPSRAGAAFRRAGQAKLEYTLESGASYAGVTVGGRQAEPPWVGGYASVTLSDSVSAYLDASVMRGSEAWMPRGTGDGGFEFARRSAPRRARVLAVAGLRYTWPATLDARAEYLRQDAGYSRWQVRTAAPLAVAQQPSRAAIERWLTPGLEFLGRDLMLVSMTARDLGAGGRLDLQGRYVRSFTDDSGAAFVTATVDASDALVVFASVTLTHGAELSEFTRVARAGAVAGLIWSW